jgi:hypothetical protein
MLPATVVQASPCQGCDCEQILHKSVEEDVWWTA